ncbi:MAG: bifunctional 2-polyprenyl-6-hydroxyphenol methylase/3-demethylubiquinol 3-O-methyltransferase UbiG [Alphaproteobacteria bacterium]|nr:bifunctional 2-polyprenyl-6-hydroxyphenol methylase/3-demethylubiquinol 3-O-methyltransferase UbiG [Alphaproteobacteria bacterium]
MSSVDKLEIENFSKDSSHWWDEAGPFAPLHRLNPVRLGWIRRQISDHFGLTDDKGLSPFTGLRVLDIGCGGGLICEPLARLGATLTGADADENAIKVAKDHAARAGLEIRYVPQPAEDIDEQFDIVLALEIIEHVKDPEYFVKNVAARVKPGGLAVFSTINRTPKAFALGIVAAEYLLRWVPRGTHTWKKFVRPSELAGFCRAADLIPGDITGLVFNPIENAFTLSKRDIAVNYFMSASKQK